MAITITSITPNTGPTVGGTIHYINGTDLNTVTGVTVGGAAASFTALSPTLIRLTLPPGTTGAQNVVLAPGAVTLTGGLTYTASTSTEALVSTLARKWRVQVNTGTVSVPVWTDIRGVASVKPTLESNLEKDSDYDGGGYASSTKTEIEWGLELKLMRKVGVTSGNYDSGQEKLRLAADQFGALGTVQVRWFDRTPGTPEAYSGYATVSWEPEGGDTKDLDAVTCKLSGQGQRTAISNPAT